MNEYDSEKILGLLVSSYRPVSAIEDARVVFINTCSVREKGHHKLNSFLGRLTKMKSKFPEMIIGVGGCVAQQEGKRIIEAFRAVDFVVGTHNLSLIPSLIANVVNKTTPIIAVDYREDWEELPDDLSAMLPDKAVDTTQGITFGQASSSIRAMVAIQRGCSKHCSFCVVPTTRGPEISRDPEEIIKEVKAKIRGGAREVMLLGQTVNSYGSDLRRRNGGNGAVSFEGIVQRIADIEGVERIRFTSPHPREVRSDLIELFARVPQLMPHIHLPLQSGSDKILKLMNRNYSSDRYLEIVSKLKNTCPQIAITTDIIVGFPRETDDDFEATLRMMKEVGYSGSYSFCYSPRPNTSAVEKFNSNEEVPIVLAKQRLSVIKELQDELSNEYNCNLVGKVFPVLVEKEHKQISSIVRGRIPQNVQVEICSGKVRLGEIVDVLIERASSHGIRGRLALEKGRNNDGK